MRITRMAAVAATALLCAAVATPALAHGYYRHKPRVSLHFGFGAPYYPYYYGPRYVVPYYAAPVVVAPAAPTTYIEQAQPQLGAAPAPAAPTGYWYYCAESNAYYPYVQQCAGAWQPVAPTPPGR